MGLALDTLGLYEAHASMPEQVVAAARAARGLAGLPDRSAVEHVVVLGMGSSGLVGDVLAATAGPFMAVPVVVEKSYQLPAFVGEGSLVFAVSFSGDTEEVLEAAADAAVQGAKVVAITSGGELAKLASGWGAPIVVVPDTIPRSRAALGSTAIPPLVALEDVGLFPGATQWIDLAARQLERRRDQLVADPSPAEDLARRIGRTIPLVHGGGPLGAAAAQRWKAQVNENAKSPAFWAASPELYHNEIAGWGQHGDVTRRVLTQVVLRHDGEHPQLTRRFSLAKGQLGEVVADVVEVQAEGDGDLAQLLDLILVGDFTSLHLAAREGLDPGPVPAIDALKRALKES